MKEIGASGARNHLGTVLGLVERGEEVVITRRGKAVARLVPIAAGVDHERARQAAQRIREMRKDVTLGGISIRALIDEGRVGT